MAELSVETFDLRLRTPLRASWGELTERALLKVRVDFGGNDYGDGEAAPLEAYDGVSFAAVRAALDAYARVLARASPRSTHAELLAACAAERRCRRRWRRSTWRCGTGRAAAPGSRSRS